MRALAVTCGTVVAFLATVTPVWAASTPGPATMRAALADPLEKDFTEQAMGTSASLLQGPFDAATYAQSAASDVKSRASLLLALHQYGFVTGYGRNWYKSRRSELMEELLMVFASDWGAQTTASSSKSTYASDPTTQSFFDPQLMYGAYGLTINEGGYHWTVVIFTKGNDMFVIERGAPSDYPTSQATAQARQMFDVAPARFDVRDQSPLGFIGPNFRLIAIGALVVMLMTACAIAVVLFVVFSRQQQQP